MANAGADNFDFDLVSEFEGYVTVRDKTNVSEKVMVRGSKNVYKKDTGNISVRPGLKRRGTANSAASGVISSFEWNTSQGRTYVLRTQDDKLQVESDIADDSTLVWYDLLDDLSSMRLVFSPWWDEDQSRDKLLFVNGEDTIWYWPGGITKIGTPTSSTIPKSDTDTTWDEDGFRNQTNISAGDNTTQFDVTNPSGTTFRYTFDGTGTDPSITATTFPIGSYVLITSETNFAAGNQGLFQITGVAANYFEVTNASGVVEANITIGSGFLYRKFANILSINGNLYGFTNATDVTTLTGIYPDPSGEPADSIALQVPIPEPLKPAEDFDADFIRVIGNQAFVGSYTNRNVYVSAADDFTDYVVPVPRVSGDPELLTLDDNPSGIGVRQGNAHISAGLSDWYVISFTDIAVSSTLTQQTLVDKQQTAALDAALAHEFIDMVGDDIVYLSQDNQLRLYGIFRNITTSKYPSLSEQVKDEFKNEDFTGGMVRAVGDDIYVLAPLSGKTYIHRTHESVDGVGNVIADRHWNPPWILNASRVALIDGQVYVHSNANPQIYQVWDTEQWHDDSPSDDPIPYNCVMRMSYRNHERRQGIISFDKPYFEGYMTQGTFLNAYVLSDYNGATGIQEVPINSNEDQASFFEGAASPAIGDASIGSNPLGDGLSNEEEQGQESLPKFRAIPQINPVNCFEYQLVVFSEAADSRWEILALGTNATVNKNQQAAYIIK